MDKMSSVCTECGEEHVVYTSIRFNCVLILRCSAAAGRKKNTPHGMTTTTVAAAPATTTFAAVSFLYITVNAHKQVNTSQKKSYLSYASALNH